MPRADVKFIPWDATSPQHVQRLVLQREACGWNAPKVAEEWRDAQLDGSKCIYWLAFSDYEPRKEEFIQQHIEKYPLEEDPLVDTGKTILAKPITPAETSFIPIGHVALDSDEPFVAEHNIDVPKNGAFWIKTLYVSYALQNIGLGSSALDYAEKMATNAPLNARHLLLDTLCYEDQMNEELSIAFYGRPAKFSNEKWYASRGYRKIALVTGKYNEPDRHGKVWPLRTVFMQKDLV